ncbi:GTP-binding protein Rit2 [Dendroctonus ponderosae]|uniref:GTP-binding protein Rit2 n=1 Tax=Dendroctonus ponderosae TaxID=77166 RepID=UPI0020351442|nr:GTP-binding protein Rit2 [Dendroctonus ponderosae]
MAGEASYKKKGKLSRQESNKSSKDPEIEVDKFAVGGSNNQNKSRSGSRVYKIVVLGDGGVGKSGISMQVVQNMNVNLLCPFAEDSYQQQAVIDGVPALLDILDTAGQVEFTAMRDQYMRCGEGFVICYSVTDRHSFQEASEYRKLIQKVRASEDTPIVLIGNKFDLHLQRKVTTEEGQFLAQQFNCPFYETSACLRSYVDDAFHSLVRQIRKKEESSGLYSNERKLRRHSKWWRLRSIFALVFKRKRPTNSSS